MKRKKRLHHQNAIKDVDQSSKIKLESKSSI